MKPGPREALFGGRYWPTKYRISGPAWLAIGFAVLFLTKYIFIGQQAAFYGDDGLHVEVALQQSALGHLAFPWHRHHPPIYLALLNLWTVFGYGEAALRSLNWVAAAFVFTFAFLSIRRLSNGGAAAVAVAMLALSPMLGLLVLELRDYVPALAFLFMAFYYFERWLAEDRRGWLALATLGCWGALCTSYTTVLVLGFLLLYVLLRLHDEHKPRRVFVEFAAFQLSWILLGAIVLFSKMVDVGVVEQQYLKPQVFRPGNPTGRLAYGWHQLSSSITQLGVGVSPGWGSLLAYVGLLGGAIFGGLRRYASPFARAILLVGPLLLSAALSAAGLFPGGNTRHASSLLLSLSLTCALGGDAVWYFIRNRYQRVWPNAGKLGAATALLLVAFVMHQRLDMPRMPNSARDVRKMVVESLRLTEPMGEAPLFTDYLTAIMVGFYVRQLQSDGVVSTSLRNRFVQSANVSRFRKGDFCGSIASAKQLADRPAASGKLVYGSFEIYDPSLRILEVELKRLEPEHRFAEVTHYGQGMVLQFNYAAPGKREGLTKWCAGDPAVPFQNRFTAFTAKALTF